MAGLLLQLVLAVGAAHARSATPHTELAPPHEAGATLAPPVKRHPDVTRPERLLRVPIPRHATALRLASLAQRAHAGLTPVPTVAPRARSHAQRMRGRAPDDPPQSSASA